MKVNPKISIITPCFNAALYIEQTILSIINQDYDNLEYIIIDGGSTDGTIDIIKKYENKIAYWISEPDNGQSEAINKGIAVSTGDVFNWVNGDDYLEVGVLKLVGEYFQKSNVNVFCSPTMLFNEEGNIRKNDYTPIEKGVYELLNSSGLNQQGMFWRLSKIKELNGVNSSFNFSMDLDLWKRYLINFGIDNVVFEDVITGFFRLSNSSKTGADFEENFHLFEKENNAALVQYATLVNDKYANVIKYLFPNFNNELAVKEVQSHLDVVVIKNWLKLLFYKKVMRLFYANDFKKAFVLLKIIPIEDYEGKELKNLKSFRRWSAIKRWL